MQHAAGFILTNEIRKYARGRLDERLSAEARDAARKAIDDAVYGLMMLVDGVTGGLRNSQYRVDLKFIVKLMEEPTDKTVQEIDLRDGDGMCTGFHGWKKDDFGDDPVVVADA